MKLRRKTTEEKETYLKILARGLAVLFLVAGFIGFRDVKQTADESKDTVEAVEAIAIAGRDGQVRFQAGLNWMLCSRDIELVTPDKRENYLKICKGYETPESALRMEKAKQKQQEDNHKKEE